jgi:hypothetical protein
MLPDPPFRGSAAVAAGMLTRRQLSGPKVRRLFPDVYTVASLPMDHFTWCEAASLLLPAGAAIGGWSALRIFCPGVDAADDAPVEVEVPPPGRLRAHPRLRIRRGRLGAGDVRRYGDLRVTSPIRTAFDVARRSPLSDAVIGLDALLFRGTVTREALSVYITGHSSSHGARHAREAFDLARRGAQSPMETCTRLLLVLSGLPEPVLQDEVRNSLGRVVGRVDLAYPEHKVAIEYEGDHHRERSRFKRDLARINQLRLAGWTVIQLTADDLLRTPERTIGQVRHALGL